MSETATGTRLVKIRCSGRVALIRMDQPTMYNALSAEMRHALEKAIHAANADPDIAGIVIAGDEKAFCAGGDLSTMTKMSRTQAEQRIRSAHHLPRLIHASPKPVVAAVEGICAGAGLALAAICDLVVAGTQARFLTAFEKVGLMPDLGASWSVAARIGTQAARRLFLLGATLTATEAQAAGLTDFLTESGSAEKEAVKLINRLARTAPGTRRAVREIFRHPPASLEEALNFETRRQPMLYLSADLHEGIAAFREKREPVWRGK